MIYTLQISKAIKFSSKTHQVYQNQKRKGKEIPYITHPLAVGLILSMAGASEDVIVAGILHDTIEDSPREKKVSRAMIAERFGQTVAELVESVTEADKSLAWDERKHAALERICDYGHDSLLIKSADVISNVTELIDDYGRYGDEIFDRFSVPKDKTLKHYTEAINIILSCWPENPLQSDLNQLASELKRLTA